MSFSLLPANSACLVLDGTTARKTISARETCERWRSSRSPGGLTSSLTRGTSLSPSMPHAPASGRRAETRSPSPDGPPSLPPFTPTRPQQGGAAARTATPDPGKGRGTSRGPAQRTTTLPLPGGGTGVSGLSTALLWPLQKTLAELTYADVRGLQDALLSFDRAEATESDLAICDAAVGRPLLRSDSDALLDALEGVPLEASYDVLERFLSRTGPSAASHSSVVSPGARDVAGTAPHPRRTLLFSPETRTSHRQTAFETPASPLVSSPILVSPTRATPPTPSAPASTQRTPSGLRRACPTHVRSSSKAGGVGIASGDEEEEDSPGLSPVAESRGVTPRQQRPRVPQPSRWALADFDLGRKIGEGRLGKTFLARVRGTSRSPVALKCIAKEAVQADAVFERLQREVEQQAFAAQRCEYVLGLYASFWDDEHIFLVLEYAEDGSLADYLKHHQQSQQPRRRAAAADEDPPAAPRGLPEDLVRRLAGQLATALSVLHSHGIIHGGVCTQHVLLRRSTGTGELEARLAGFSDSVPLAEGSDRCHHALQGGKLDYMSPEQVQGEACGTKVDMWALGVLTYELLCGGTVPFEHHSSHKTHRRIALGEVSYPPSLSVAAHDFVRALLTVDEAKRLSATAALSHPFLASTMATASAPVPPHETDAWLPKQAPATMTTSAIVGGGGGGGGGGGSAPPTSLAASVSPCSSVLDVCSLTGPSFGRMVGAPAAAQATQRGRPSASVLSPLSAPPSPTCNGSVLTMTGTDGFLSLNSLESTALTAADASSVSRWSPRNTNANRQQRSDAAVLVQGLSLFLPHNEEEEEEEGFHAVVAGATTTTTTANCDGALLGGGSSVPSLLGDVSVSTMSFTCQPSLSAVNAASTMAINPQHTSPQHEHESAPAGGSEADTTLHISSPTVSSAEDSCLCNSSSNSTGVGDRYRTTRQQSQQQQDAASVGDSPLPLDPFGGRGRRRHSDPTEGLPEVVGASSQWQPERQQMLREEAEVKRATAQAAAMYVGKEEEEEQNWPYASLSPSQASGSDGASRSQHGISRSTQRSHSTNTTHSTTAAVLGAGTTHISNSSAGSTGKREAGRAREASSDCVQRPLFTDEAGDDWTETSDDRPAEQQEMEMEEEEDVSHDGGGRVVWSAGPSSSSLSYLHPHHMTSSGTASRRPILSKSIVVATRREPTATTQKKELSLLDKEERVELHW